MDIDKTNKATINKPATNKQQLKEFCFYMPIVSRKYYHIIDFFCYIVSTNKCIRFVFVKITLLKRISKYFIKKREIIKEYQQCLFNRSTTRPRNLRLKLLICLTSCVTKTPPTLTLLYKLFIWLIKISVTQAHGESDSQQQQQNTQ